MIKRINTSQNTDQEWFTFTMGLSHHLFSDYVGMKLCYSLEPLSLASSNFVNMVEVVEKSLKVYLGFKLEKDDTLSYFSENFGHNLEKMRMQASTYNSIFNDSDIMGFTDSFNDKPGQLYQKLRYGAHKNISGFSTRLSNLLPVVEKIFYICITDHDENKKKMLFSSSLLFFLITSNNFAQANNSELLLSSIKYRNDYFEYYENYANKLKAENDKIYESLKNII